MRATRQAAWNQISLRSNRAPAADSHPERRAVRALVQAAPQLPQGSFLLRRCSATVRVPTDRITEHLHHRNDERMMSVRLIDKRWIWILPGALSPRPVLDAQHRRARRVLDLSPTPCIGPSGRAGRAASRRCLRARVCMRVRRWSCHCRRDARKSESHRCARAAFELPLALFERCRAQVVAVQLDQVEGKEEHGRVVRAGMQLIELRLAVVAAHDGLAIDHDRAHRNAMQCLNDARVARHPIKAATIVAL
jgi:hypothetical protein